MPPCVILWDFCRMETRYLLIIAKDTSVRRIVIDACKQVNINPEVVFGSGFPGDMHFSQVIIKCRYSPTSTVHLL